MAYPDFFPRRINMRVPALQFASEVSASGIGRVDFGAPAALSTTSLANVVLSTTGVALTLQVSDGTLLLNGAVGGATTARWGRGVQLVGDGASTRTITILGWDYLGQKIKWTGVLNGTTPVKPTKVFMWIDSIVFGAAADTVSVSVGTTDLMGLPYQAASLLSEMKNNAVAANAGTFVAAVLTDPQTATTGDPRGTYLPVTVIPDGTNTFSITVNYDTDKKNLHGVAHFGG